ncbi:hypothetical protein L1987_19576 [Smallanthus sonchifolius]|uniref:Uncharacterized protein n=1 Tax=Smallanthus sonchifolius TaxID=185202 RepID=A0ACB9IR78_9ASTR|nr:hypothetical protein L1987_19576 [Smallanthus sonchifolius]
MAKFRLSDRHSTSRGKLGWNLVTGNERHITSWKSEDDPASGEFSYSIDTRGYPQAVLKEGQEVKFWRGPWNGLRYTGSPSMTPTWFYNFTFVLNQKEIYYQYNLVDTSVFTRLVIQPNGRLERLLWIDSKQEWNVYTTPQIDRCDQYAVCGPFGICNISNSPVCVCLKGFEPTSPYHWRNTDWSRGCRHTVPLDCKPGEGFNKYSNVKLPDTQGSCFNQTMTLAECEKKCKRNCSCTAYTNSNKSGTGSGCLLWFGGLIDIRTFAENGDTLYIRMSASELGIPGNESVHAPDEDLELPLFGLSTILKATNNFSINNKLGEGGFGPVYKGVSEDGQEIAASIPSYLIKLKASGYMAPEYAGHGIFSIKSDVYSFGVLVLEIVCGEKNRGFVDKEHCNNLIGHAWGLHNEGRSLQLVAKCLGESINVSQSSIIVAAAAVVVDL